MKKNKELKVKKFSLKELRQVVGGNAKNALYRASSNEEEFNAMV
ncbi:hypothetical protein [Thalassomonas viridans]|nr:hypothetical protein [Thalassomonas viridans]